MKLSTYLKASPELAAILQHAERLIALQKLFETIVPPALAQYCRVANFKSGILVVSAANALIAAKLRQVLPRLTSGFCDRGWQVTSIQVAVQGQNRGFSPAIPAVTALDPGVRAGLETFARNAGDARVTEVVEHLLRSAAAPADDQDAPEKPGV